MNGSPQDEQARNGDSEEFGYPPELREALDFIVEETTESLRNSKGQLEQAEQVISHYLRSGFNLGFTSGELIDFFCVDTPNILESAGFVDAQADIIMTLFDSIHSRLMREIR